MVTPPFTRDPGTVEFELQAAVEGDPQGLFRFTRRVRRPAPAKLLLCLWFLQQNQRRMSAAGHRIWEMRVETVFGDLRHNVGKLLLGRIAD
jgi:hypothetical protein